MDVVVFWTLGTLTSARAVTSIIFIGTHDSRVEPNGGDDQRRLSSLECYNVKMHGVWNFLSVSTSVSVCVKKRNDRRGVVHRIHM